MPWPDLLSPSPTRSDPGAPDQSARVRGALHAHSRRSGVCCRAPDRSRTGLVLQRNSASCGIPAVRGHRRRCMPAAMLRFIALQVGAEPADLASYAERDQTRREH